MGTGAGTRALLSEVTRFPRAEKAQRPLLGAGDPPRPRGAASARSVAGAPLDCAWSSSGVGSRRAQVRCVSPASSGRCAGLREPARGVWVGGWGVRAVPASSRCPLTPSLATLNVERRFGMFFRRLFKNYFNVASVGGPGDCSRVSSATPVLRSPEGDSGPLDSRDRRGLKGSDSPCGAGWAVGRCWEPALPSPVRPVGPPHPREGRPYVPWGRPPAADDGPPGGLWRKRAANFLCQESPMRTD